MTTSRTCAYCGTSERPTREHLWPASLHRRLVKFANKAESRFWLQKIEKEIPKEPTVRDVCSDCNNGELAVLDGYICQLFDRSFAHVHKRYEKVVFEYDYHRLKRWLLKMCFNSARIHSAIDEIVLPPLLPYIMGKSESVGRSVQLYVQLSYPAEIPESLLDPEDLRPMMHYPTLNRCGNLWFNVEGVGKKMLRAVHLQSFSFYLAFFPAGECRAALDHFTNAFLQQMQETVLLRPSRNKVTLICNGMNAWDSVAEARANKFVWNDDKPPVART
jgi:hypothetical protein